MFPLGDDNPRRSTPFVTIGLIAANLAVFLGKNLGASEGELERFVLEWGFDSDRPFSVQVVTSQFMHADILHILGNLWVLWIVGDNVEDKLGRVRYLLLYLLGGCVAAWSYAALANAASPPPGAFEEFGRNHPPLVGASGAIYAVMGMYLVLFPDARIRVLFWIFLFVQVVRMPAKLFIGITIVLDFFRTVAAGGPAFGRVATAAHVGGGLFGIVAALVLKRAVGGSGVGDAWDVHTGFSKSVRGGTEPLRGADPPAASDRWFAPPEPMEDGADDLHSALVELVRSGRVREAIDVYPAYVAHRREQPLPADIQLEIANEFYRQGLARDGISAYRRFADENPDDPDAPEAAFRIGILYVRGLGDGISAAPWLHKAAATHPNPQIRAYATAELKRLGG